MIDMVPDYAGFVIAMRARLWPTGRVSDPAVRPGGELRAPRAGDDGDATCEWLIVARWGELGRYLSVSRCRAPAAGSAGAPLGLTPRETALAELIAAPRGSRRATCFRFLPAL